MLVCLSERYSILTDRGSEKPDNVVHRNALLHSTFFETRANYSSPTLDKCRHITLRH